MEPENKTIIVPAKPIAIEPQGPVPLGENACQWFLLEKKYCDKIKKEMRCDGNVKNCPF
jgi:hypothetical protein